MKTYSAQALPYEFDFDLEHTALLIIDMQRDFCEHGGFGEASNTASTGIDRIDGTSDGEAVSTAYYSVQGERISSTYRGLVIEVQTMADGSKTVRKMIRK